jgi:hypothetical protein
MYLDNKPTPGIQDHYRTVSGSEHVIAKADNLQAQDRFSCLNPQPLREVCMASEVQMMHR